MADRKFFRTVGLALMAAAEVFNAAADDEADTGNDAPAATSRRRTSGSASDAADDTPAPRASSRRATGGSTSDGADAPRNSRSKDDEPDDEPAPRRKAKEGLDYETEVRPAIVKLSKDHGREAAAGILEQFTNPTTKKPVTKGQELHEDDYDEALKLVLDEQKRLDKKAQREKGADDE